MSTTRSLTTLQKLRKERRTIELELDFTALHNIGNIEEKQKPQKANISPLECIPIESIEERLKAVKTENKAITEQTTNKRANILLTAQQEDHKRMAEAYGEYQKNIRVAGQIRTEVFKGIRQGEDTNILLLKACKAISLMTGDSLFYKQVLEDMKAVKGKGLLEPAPLQIELEEVQTRLRNMRKALDRETQEEHSMT